MPFLEVDLNARVLSADHNVWVARPGRQFKLFPDFVADSVVFPDLPGLELVKGQPLDQHADLQERVLRARRIRSWHRAGRPEDSVPSRDLNTYQGHTRTLSLAQFEGVVRSYFDRAKRGDLVVVPPRSYKEDAYVGEFIDEPTDPVQVGIRLYPGENVAARRVRWLARMPKRKLPLPLLEALEKPNAFVLLAQSLREDIYKAAYGNYMIDNELYTARFDVSSETFTVEDEFLLQAFFKFAAANTKAIAEGHPDQVRGIMAAAFSQAGDYVPDLQTNINSPGSITLFCKRITPLVAAVLLSMAVQVGPEAYNQAQAGQIVFMNSKAAGDDPCTARVEEQVMTQLELLGLDGWAEACEKAREVAERTGVKSPGRTTRR